eukprot:gene7532-11539_t
MMLRNAVVAALAWTASAGLRGVGPQEAGSYPDKAEFKCFEGGNVVPWDKVNDDYCDCDDGSDEPGTAACSSLTPRALFYCANKGHKAEKVVQSRVNDGICDCCDGTDELGTAAGCKDICEEVATVWAKEKEEHDRKVATGLARKAELVAQAKAASESQKAEKAKKDLELKALHASLELQEAEEKKQIGIEESERAAIKAESEKKKEEHDRLAAQAKEAREQATAALQSTLEASVAKHGAMTKGGKVALLRDLSFVNGKKHPAGTAATVTSVTTPDKGAASMIVQIPGEDTLYFKAGPVDVHPTEQQPVEAAEAATRSADAPGSPCVSWTQTANCDPNGKAEQTKPCSEVIPKGRSGYCLCDGDRRMEYKCEHEPMTCQSVCETGEDSTVLKHWCPEAYPYPSAESTDFEHNVCYTTEQTAAAGSGPCGTWCARDAEWFKEHECTWGCECGQMCGEDRQAATVDVVGDEDAAFVVDTGSSHVRPEAKAAREAATSTRSRANALKGDVERLEKDLELNYGPENEFLPLKGQCFELKTPEYVYKLCPFSEVKQGGTSMGKWSSWGKQTYGSWGGQDDLSIQIYEH